MKRLLLSTTIVAFLASTAFVQSQNIGFEDGTATDWTTGGGTGTFNPQTGGINSGQGKGVSIVTGTQTFTNPSHGAFGTVGSPYYQPAVSPTTWTISPYGSYMALLQPGSGTFTQMTTALGLSTDSISSITSMLHTQATAANAGNGNPTTAAWLSKTVTLTAGQTFTMAWNYTSTDYVPYNDGSITTLVNATDGTIVGTVNNKNAQYSLLGFTNPGTGDYSVGTFGFTGWQTATYTVSQSGTYIIGFSSFNLDDNALSPILFVDENKGTVTKNGQPFGPIAPNAGSGAPDTSSNSNNNNNNQPQLITSITGNTPIASDTIDTAPVFNNGILKMVSTATDLTQPFVLQDNGTIDQNGMTSKFNGVISGTGALVITNTGTGGSVTLTNNNTYTGSTIINNGATVINQGNISSSNVLTNNGTFTNNGIAPGVVNNGTVTNNGTTGPVTNSGIFNNLLNAITGMFTNASTGTVNNKGTLASLTNNSIATSVGTIGNLTNNETGTVNIGGGKVVIISSGSNYLGNPVNVIEPQIEATIAAIKTKMPDAKIVMVMPFQNMSDYYNGSGTTTIPSTAASAAADKFGIPKVIFTSSTDGIHPDNYAGVVSQIQTLTGVPSNQWYFVGDSITFALANTAGAATIYAQNGKTPQFILDNFVPLLPGTTPVVVGNINNSGIFNLNGPATLGTVTNSGYFSIQYSGGHVTLPAFTQTATGGLVMVGGQQLNINGTANLNGTLIVMKSLTDFGRYSLINANSVLGTFTTLAINENINSYLKYSATDVKLYITPSVTATQQGINSIKNDSTTMNSIVTSRTIGILDNQCSGTNGCISIDVGSSKSGTGNLSSGGITVTKNVNENARIGIFLNRAFTNPSTNTVNYKPGNPVMGGYVGFTNDKLNVTLSGANGNGTYTFNRSLIEQAEAGSGSSKVNSKALQAKISYNIPLLYDITLSPYAGLRYSELSIGGYTENGPLFPLSINPYKQKSTDLVAGLGINKKLTNQLSVNTSVGVTKNLKTNTGSIAGQSEIYNLEAFDYQLDKGKSLSFGVGAGVSYEFLPNQTVGINVGFEQKSIVNPKAGSIGLSYTYGF